MSEVEYVAVVRVERVERRVIPKGTPLRGQRATLTSEDKIVRDKAEVLAFTVRAEHPHQVKAMVRDMMQAGMAGASTVNGEPDTDEEDEDDL